MAIPLRPGSPASVGLAGLAQSHARPSRRFNPKFIVASVVLLGVLGFLGYNALQTATVYYYYPSEIIHKTVSFTPDQQLRVTGKLIPGSDHVNAVTDTLTFDILDTTDNATTMHVQYTGIRPDTFGRPDVSVVVTGTYQGGPQATFTAKELLAKCPSKYQAEADGTGR